MGGKRAKYLKGKDLCQPYLARNVQETGERLITLDFFVAAKIWWIYLEKGSDYGNIENEFMS